MDREVRRYARCAMATEPEEGKRPGLHWPEHDLVPASRREDPDTDFEPPTPAATQDPSVPEEPLTASVLFTVASRLEGLKASLTSMGARVESLARSEEQFREFTTARLGEHTQQIADSMREISTQLADHAKAQGKAVADQSKAQQKALSEVAEEQRVALSALTESQKSASEHQAKAQTKAFEKMQSGIDESSRAAAEATDGLQQVRQALEDASQALEVLTGHVQAVAEDVPSLRAELIDFIGRTDSRQEELATELGRLVEEVKVLRRRMPVRSASASAPAKRASRRAEPEPEPDDDDFIVEEPAAPSTPRRRASRSRRGD